MAREPLLTPGTDPMPPDPVGERMMLLLAVPMLVLGIAAVAVMCVRLVTGA